MAKSIISQTGDLVNYDNAAAVYMEDNLVENPDGTKSLTYPLCADTIWNITYILCEYDTEDEALTARNALVKWLECEAIGVYKMKGSEGVE